jgi:hypothetical protein
MIVRDQCFPIGFVLSPTEKSSASPLWIEFVHCLGIPEGRQKLMHREWVFHVCSRHIFEGFGAGTLIARIVDRRASVRPTLPDLWVSRRIFKRCFVSLPFIWQWFPLFLITRSTRSLHDLLTTVSGSSGSGNRSRSVFVSDAHKRRSHSESNRGYRQDPLSIWVMNRFRVSRRL